MFIYQKYIETDIEVRFDIVSHHIDSITYKIEEG